MTTLHTFTIHVDLPDGTHWKDAETWTAQAIANYLHDVLRKPGNVMATNTHIDAASEVRKVAHALKRTGDVVERK
jgi:hypothetical protein